MARRSLLIHTQSVNQSIIYLIVSVFNSHAGLREMTVSLYCIQNGLFAESANGESRRECRVVTTPVGPYSPSQVSYETFVWETYSVQPRKTSDLQRLPAWPWSLRSWIPVSSGWTGGPTFQKYPFWPSQSPQKGHFEVITSKSPHRTQFPGPNAPQFEIPSAATDRPIAVPDFSIQHHAVERNFMITNTKKG